MIDLKSTESVDIAVNLTINLQIFLCSENVVIISHLLHIFKISNAKQNTFIMEEKTMNPDQTAPFRSSLIRVHIVNNMRVHFILFTI